MAQATVSVTFPQNYANVRLAYSTASDLSNPSYSSTFATTNKTAKITVTSLATLTTYYYGVEVNGTIQTAGRGKFTTAPTPNSATSYTCVWGSCARSGSNNAIFTTIKNANPAFFIQMGDIHYENITTNDVQLYRNAYDMVFGQPNPASLYANVPTYYIWDDHDYCGDYANGGYNADITSPSRDACHQAYRERVPHLPLQGASNEPVYQSFVWGRIRYILLDIHTLRSDYTITDNASKTMLGATQKAWLKNELVQPEPIKVMMSGQPWLDSVQDDDNWSYFTTERKEIMDYIKTNNLMDKVMMISGDMHGLAIDDGSNNTFATGGGVGFPIFQAGGLDQDSSIKGGPYSVGTVTNGSIGQQYGLMTVTDSGGTITVKWDGMRNNTVMLTYSKTFSGTSYSIDTTPPNEVTNLASSSITSTGVTLTWTASTSTDVANYLIYNGASLVTTLASTATSYTATGLSASTNYTFSVKAKDNSGNISAGSSASFTTSAAADTTPPNDVTNLAVSNNTNGTTLALTWTGSTSTDVANYQIFNGVTLITTVSSSITSYNVTGLSGNTTYTFYVKSLDGSGNVSSGSSVTTTTPTPINVIVSDSFNRTGLLAGSSTDSYVGGTSKTWSVSGSGAYSTNGATAYCSTLAASAHNVVYVDTGYANGSGQIVATTLDPNLGTKLCFRIQDSENMINCALNIGSINVYAYVSGSSQADMGTYSHNCVDGDTVKVTTNGTAITVYLNGTQVISCTDNTSFTTNTKWGFSAYNRANARIDNFIFSI